MLGFLSQFDLDKSRCGGLQLFNLTVELLDLTPFLSFCIFEFLEFFFESLRLFYQTMVLLAKFIQFTLLELFVFLGLCHSELVFIDLLGPVVLVLLHLHDSNFILLLDFGQLVDQLVVSVSIAHQAFLHLFLVHISHFQLGHQLIHGVTVQKLCVAYFADLADTLLVMVVLRERPLVLDALGAENFAAKVTTHTDSL